VNEMSDGYVGHEVTRFRLGYERALRGDAPDPLMFSWDSLIEAGFYRGLQERPYTEWQRFQARFYIFQCKIVKFFTGSEPL